MKFSLQVTIPNLLAHCKKTALFIFEIIGAELCNSLGVQYHTTSYKKSIMWLGKVRQFVPINRCGKGRPAGAFGHSILPLHEALH